MKQNETHRSASEINVPEIRHGIHSQGLKYKISADGKSCEITGMGECADETVVIPESIEGLTVTGIGARAFRYCRRFKHIVIPRSVIRIGERAFSECRTLERVTLGTSVAYIGEGAFGNCTALSSVTLPASVTEIGNRAFMGVGKVEVPTDHPRYLSADGNLFSKDGKTLLHYDATKKEASFCIPDAVTHIGETAFCLCNGLTDVSIPDSVTSVGKYAFCGCTGLSVLNLPDSVAEIGEGAFAGIGEVRISADHPHYTGVGAAIFTKDMKMILHYAANAKESDFTVPCSVKRIGNGAFHACDSLTGVTLGDSVREIGENAFWSCKKLEKIDLGNTVSVIGRGAFKSCIRLHSVTLPASLSLIGKSAFLFCFGLSAVRYKGTRMQWKQVRLEETGWRNDSAIRALICNDDTIEYLF